MARLPKGRKWAEDTPYSLSANMYTRWNGVLHGFMIHKHLVQTLAKIVRLDPVLMFLGELSDLSA